MVAGNGALVRGYGPSYGSLTPDTYNGIKITRFQTVIFGANTTIEFVSSNSIPDTLKVKINGTVYDFQKTTTTDEDTGEVSAFWKCKAKIFENGKMYTIEFLN